jgi:hypothetical protein
MSVVLMLGTLRQEDQEFKASLGYKVRTSLKKFIHVCLHI